MATAVIWTIFISFIVFSSSQILRQYTNTTLKNQGICISKVRTTLKTFHETYKDCVVVLGSLQVTILERTKNNSFTNFSFPNLREVTGFLVVYRMNGLDSLGRLFPNLARIRGEQLLNNYGLIIHDVSTLKEIGLYGLLKIDRGGVIVWSVPQACFVDSVDWATIAPRSRHVINSQSLMSHCNFRCMCSANSTYNHCWNNRKCQIYVEGPEADPCHEQCLGCRKTRSNECSLCRYYTYNKRCVSKCPENTIILPDSQYCISSEECNNLDGWIWNNTCVFGCPVDYLETKIEDVTTCVHCTDCSKTCGDQVIQSVSSIQAAERCVFINGSLTIHLRAVTEAMEELRAYLGHIQVVTDYIQIHGSLTISSLDFLPSLRRIGGQKLKNGQYSLIVYDMANLQALFTKNVTKNLQVDGGTLQMLKNPMLCMSHIDKIKSKFPNSPNDTIDIPEGSNGYSGACDEVSLGVQIRVIDETSALIMFSVVDLDVHYSVLYVRIPAGVNDSLVPETCSESQWFAVSADATGFGHMSVMAELTSLRPASTYAVCIESFDPSRRHLARSAIYNFSTPVGSPEPPFIRVLAARNSRAVVIRWVDHLDYQPHLKRYELDVSLIEIYDRDVTIKDQCKHVEPYIMDFSHHAVVMMPPAGYARGCESMCGVLAAVTEGAMVDEYFDVCHRIDCNIDEEPISENTTFGDHVKTLVLNLTAPREENVFQIGDLAPYRDYRFRIRACTAHRCSRFVREVVRTLASDEADVPTVISVSANVFGQISVKWEAPKLTNGPILSYSIEVFPRYKNESFPQMMPKSWCISANQTDGFVKTVTADKYLVRVCTRSMGSNGACTKFVTVSPNESTPNIWHIGIIFGLLLYVASIAVGYLYKKRRVSVDMVPIVDFTSTIRSETEPPAKMFSDFVSVYAIPIRETQI